MKVIVDIDGTVADCAHRRHFVATKPANWAAFNAGAHLDKPIYPVINVVQALMEGRHDIRFVSGRSGDMRSVTLWWLAGQGIGVFKHSLFMRNVGDFRQDSVVKEEILDNLIASGWTPDMVIDDRKQVIDMWKRRGIFVLAVNGGEDF